MEDHPVSHCKNCSTEVDGHYCAFCGQRYHAHKESFGELVYEFVSDFVHFDSRFFKTALPLIFNPGKLTKSYNEGRQRSQFHPIRLYMFSSFVYFLLLFSFGHLEEGNDQPITSQSGASVRDSLGKKDIYSDSDLHFSLASTPYNDSLFAHKVKPEVYLAQQKALPKSRKAGLWERIVMVKVLKINQEGTEGKRAFFKKVTANFLHNIPKTLFVLLPLFALLLKLLYVRHRQFFYVDHAVLSLHYFSFVFLLLVLSNYVLDNIFGTSFFIKLAIAWMFVYLLLAMKRLYGQSWPKTVVKYVALLVLFSFSIVFTVLANMTITMLVM